jgi:hypothetical protein
VTLVYFDPTYRSIRRDIHRRRRRERRHNRRRRGIRRSREGPGQPPLQPLVQPLSCLRIINTASYTHREWVRIYVATGICIFGFVCTHSIYCIYDCMDMSLGGLPLAYGLYTYIVYTRK